MQLKSEVTSRTSLSRVIQDPRLDLYKRDRASTPLEDVIEAMRTRDIRIEPVEHPGLTGKDWMSFRVRFTYPDPHKAQWATQTLITKFMEDNSFLQRAANHAVPQASPSDLQALEERIAVLEKKLGIAPEAPFPYGNAGPSPAVAGVNLSVIDPPSLPEKPAAPNRAMFAALGFGSGLVVAVLVAAFRRRTPPAVALPA